jgi:SAM-dependent methyltransferase
VNYRGFEPSEALRQAATPLWIQEGGFPIIPASDSISDVTVCFAVIQHLPTQAEREAAVVELLRITKPGGWIIATSWHPTGELSRQTVTPLNQGETGDVWVGWKADGANVQRYIHDFSHEEWKELWNHPLLEIEQIGLFGRDTWTENLSQGRNWCVIAQKRS